MDALPPSVTINLGSVGNRVLVNHSRSLVSSIRKSTSPMACLNSIDCRILEILVWNLGFTSHFSHRGRLVTFGGGVACKSVECWLIGGLVLVVDAVVSSLLMHYN